MRVRDPAADCTAYESQLARALDTVLAGDLGPDQASVERRVVESLGALTWLTALHHVDKRGRCRVCRRRGILRRQTVCTVYRALFIHMRVPARSAAATVTVGLL